jgi:hypothetical protein
MACATSSCRHDEQVVGTPDGTAFGRSGRGWHGGKLPAASAQDRPLSPHLLRDLGLERRVRPVPDLAAYLATRGMPAEPPARRQGPGVTIVIGTPSKTRRSGWLWAVKTHGPAAAVSQLTRISNLCGSRPPGGSVPGALSSPRPGGRFAGVRGGFAAAEAAVSGTSAAISAPRAAWASGGHRRRRQEARQRISSYTRPSARARNPGKSGPCADGRGHPVPKPRVTAGMLGIPTSAKFAMSLSLAYRRYPASGVRFPPPPLLRCTTNGNDRRMGGLAASCANPGKSTAPRGRTVFRASEIGRMMAAETISRNGIISQPRLRKQ